MHRRRSLLFLLLLLLGASAVAGTPARADDPPSAFLCREVGRAVGTTAAGADVVDHFETDHLDVRRPRRFCEPVALDGTALAEPALPLVGYRTHASGRQPRRSSVPVSTSFGETSFDLRRTTLLLLPAVTGAGGPPLDPNSHATDEYRCRRASSSDLPPAPLPEVEVMGAGGAVQSFTLGAPRSLCSPAEVDAGAMKKPAWHLACYAARATSAATPRIRDLEATSDFGTSRLDVSRGRELCLPARALPACNGSPELCGRPFDEVAYATTHNAMSNLDDGFIGPNQRYTVRRQLDEGVRGLMLDTHYDAGQASLCHAYCQLGSTPLVETLADIRDFLVRHPYEVVSIIFESYVSAADTQAAFAAAGLLDLVHAQAVGDPWPTLAEMIAADRRLVVFTDNQGGTYPWYHHVWAYAFETHYSWANPQAMNCNPNRGDPDHSLFILNHFLTQVFGSPELASQVNFNPFFVDRALQCQAERGTLPNFVTVDFHDIGDTLAVVDTLNH
jgi:hypothetical protein